MKRPSAGIAVCVIVVICLIGIVAFDSVWECVLPKKVGTIDADTVVMLHSSDGGASSQEGTITEEKVVSELLTMYHSLEVVEMSRPMAEERVQVNFYKEDELVTEWYISLFEEDGVMITSSDTFGMGNHVVKSRLDYGRILEIFNMAVS